MKGEEFKAWLREGAPLDDGRAKAEEIERRLRARRIEGRDGVVKVGDCEIPVELLEAKPADWQRELLGEFPAGDEDVIATSTQNGLKIEIVERNPPGMREKDRKRRSRTFKISREDLAKLSSDEAKALIAEKLEIFAGMSPKRARALVETRLTFGTPEIAGKRATSVVIDDPLEPLKLDSIQITSTGTKTGRVTVDAQTNRGLKRVEFSEDEVNRAGVGWRGSPIDLIRRMTLEKLGQKDQETVKKWLDESGIVAETKDGPVEPEGKRVVGIDWGSGQEKTAVGVFRQRSDGTIVVEDFATFENVEDAYGNTFKAPVKR